MDIAVPTSVPGRVRVRRDRFRQTTRQLEDLSSPPMGDIDRWRSELHQGLVSLEDVLADHISETEVDGGFLDELVETSSGRLQTPVARLRAEHTELQAHLKKVRARAEDHSHPEALRASVRALVDRLEEHYDHGADLLWEAYGVDLGAAD